MAAEQGLKGTFNPPTHPPTHPPYPTQPPTHPPTYPPTPVDLNGFAHELEAAKQRSRDAALKIKAGGVGGKPLLLQVDETAYLQKKGVPPTLDEDKYTWDHAPDGQVLALWTHAGWKETVGEEEGEVVGVLLDKTAFYAEAGGQVADTGRLELGGGGWVEVVDVQVFAGYVLHIGRLGGKQGKVSVGQTVTNQVDYARRRKVAPNHTMTHVLNFALREVLGPNVDQRGSLVNEEKLRFDFSHGGAMSPEQLAQVCIG